MRVSLDIPPGLFGDDTTYAAAGRWADASNVRFWRGRAQVIGGWEKIFGEALTGVCRSVFQWTDNNAAQNIAFGTHQALQVWQSGALADITPYRPATRLTDPFTVSDGSAVVTVASPAHGLTNGETVTITSSEAVGRITLSGDYIATVADADSYTITHGSNADTAKTLGAAPLKVTNGSTTVTVTETAHGITDGTEVTISGAAAVGGITPNGTFPVSVIDADSYSFTFTSAAGSSATGGGSAVVATVPATGGGAVFVVRHLALQEGSVDGTGGAGYGTGGYGVGAYSEPSTADYFPRTWGAGAWGENLLANPRGGPIYQWQNDTSARAAELLNAPAQVTHMVVASQDMVFALGCNEEVSGDFNPLCIRHSGVRRLDQWTTAADTTAREYILPGGGRIVAGRVVGPYLLVWTTHALFLGTFVGSPGQVWRFDRVGLNCGLIGPNAAVVVGQRAFWLGPDLQFRAYGLGGAPEILPCPIRDAIEGNFAASQGDKVTAASISQFNEIRFDYPDSRDGFENSRYVTLSLEDGAWSRGIMTRTAFCDAGPSQFPIGVSDVGAAYWHERGASDDGGAFSWFIETADQYLDENQVIVINGLWPDIADQVGPVNVLFRSRLKPQAQDTERTAGPYAVGVGDDKVDVRLSGRLFNIRFSGNSAPTGMRLGKPVIDMAPAGAR